VLGTDPEEQVEVFGGAGDRRIRNTTVCALTTDLVGERRSLAVPDQPNIRSSQRRSLSIASSSTPVPRRSAS